MSGTPASQQTPTRRRLPPEVRRRQVLDAALRLIARGGPHALSIEGVAREAGVSKTVVYNSFSSLSELVGALLDREEKRALEALVAAVPQVDSEADAEDTFRQWASALASAVNADPVAWRLILSPPAGTPHRILGRIRRGRERVVEQAEGLLKSVAGNRSELDLELAARSIAAAAEELARLMLRDPGSYPEDRIADFAAMTLGLLGGGER